MKKAATTKIEHVEIKIKIGVCCTVKQQSSFHPHFEHTMYAIQNEIRNTL